VTKDAAAGLLHLGRGCPARARHARLSRRASRDKDSFPGCSRSYTSAPRSSRRTRAGGPCAPLAGVGALVSIRCRLHDRDQAHRGTPPSG